MGQQVKSLGGWENAAEKIEGEKIAGERKQPSVAMQHCREMWEKQYTSRTRNLPHYLCLPDRLLSLKTSSVIHVISTLISVILWS
jgi:hypothetical protein